MGVLVRASRLISIWPSSDALSRSRDNWLGSSTSTDLAVVPQEGLRTGIVHRGSVMRVIVALVLGILFATAVVSAWGIWIIETSEIR